MKTIFTFATLFLIISICAVSAALFLSCHYNTSALLTIVWIVSITLWIKSNMFLEKEKQR